MIKNQGTIKITVHKNHLLTLGERMYGESIELVRELVNNAYDVDSTQVHITVAPEAITIEDNGSGMSERGLTQFFEVGSDKEILKKKLKEAHLSFNSKSLVQKIKKYPLAKLERDLAKFLPKSYRKIIPLLKEKILEIYEKI